VNLVLGLLLLATAATIPPPAAAAKTPAAAAAKIPVYLHTNARDAVGAAYVVRLREALAASSAYEPAVDSAGARFVVGIVTMDPNDVQAGAGAGRSTVASATLQRKLAPGLNQFVYSWVLLVRREKVDALATGLLTAIDKEIQGLEAVTIQLLDDVRR
jgi:hypothetical protein